MRKWSENGGYNEQNKYDDGYQISEDDCWPAAASQGSVRDPDCEE
jgi:hypothetical protein